MKKAKKKYGLLRVSFVLMVLLILLVVLCIVSAAVGSAGYSVTEILKATFSPKDSPVKVIVMNLRLPRILLAVLIGSCLSASGALLQSVMRNPLADPGTIGVSAGASTAASTILLISRGLQARFLCLPLAAPPWPAFDLYDGLEKRRGPDPDHPVRCGYQLCFGGLYVAASVIKF